MSATVRLKAHAAQKSRLGLQVSGIVQGVGFRPFVYRLAHELGLTGWIENTPQGATIEIEGSPPALERFQSRLISQAPEPARIHEISKSTILTQDDTEFSIRASRQQGARRSVIPPDFATCRECIREINDPGSRRYRYPFTTCAQCGPRYSMVEGIPYDRINTTMKKFPLCRECQRDYEDMTDRRFHAEAIACPQCGPQVALWNQTGTVVAEKEVALTRSCEVIRREAILAVKGLGGFQLWVDAQSEEAVHRLRKRKHRPCKPFAVLFPSLTALKEHCHVSQGEETLLTSPETPIVLLRRKASSSLAKNVAPDNPYIGSMLPYTPLHHLLTAELQTPVVATSGNRSEEPIVTDEYEARFRLNGIADAFLVHNRPIARPVDDSVVRLLNGRLMMLRRARGFAPAPITIKNPDLKEKERISFLAVGGHLKNTVAVNTRDQVIVSQHIGDLSTPEACIQFERTVADQLKLFDVKPQAIACDLHPDYRSTIFAKKLGQAMNIPVIPVQHHYAHILSCMAEHGLEGPVLGIAWDGAGYGTDGTIWGGEFLLADYSGFTRAGHLRPFRLPGGEICMREPRRAALSLLYETFGEECLKMDLSPIRSLGPDHMSSLAELMKKNVNCPLTTSMGRLFDGISSILGLCHVNTFEGEAAMALEFAAETGTDLNHHDDYSFSLEPISPERRGKCERGSLQSSQFIADWQPLMRSVVRETFEGKSADEIGLKFHHALSKLIVDVAENFSSYKIVLSGGVFQNSLLLQQIKSELQQKQINMYTNQDLPPNDGSIAVGQGVIGNHFKVFLNTPP